MPKQVQEPGPGRSTAAAAFDELRKEIAQRNEQAHQKAVCDWFPVIGVKGIYIGYPSRKAHLLPASPALAWSAAY